MKINHLKNGWKQIEQDFYELSNTDPNSPEVNRLNKIIDAYNREIADYDAKLREFEEDI